MRVLVQWNECQDAAGWEKKSEQSSISELWGERRRLKAKRSGEQVKKERQSLENSTNSDGLFTRGKLRYTKLCLLVDGSGRN